MVVDASRPVMLILQNGEETHYQSLRELGLCLGVNSRTIHKAAVNREYLDPNGGLYCKVVYADGLPPKPEKVEKNGVRRVAP